MTESERFQLVASDKLLQELLVELDLVPDDLMYGSLGYRQFKALCQAWRDKDNAPHGAIPVIGDFVAFRQGGYGLVVEADLKRTVRPFMSCRVESVPFRKGIPKDKNVWEHTADDIESIVAGSPIRRIHLNGKVKK